MKQTNKGEADAVHVMGNGRLLVYGCGVSLGPIFGPEYTSPSFGKIVFAGGDSVSTKRKVSTNCWQHTILQDGMQTIFKDVVDPEYCVFVRKIEAEFECRLTFEPGDSVQSYVRNMYRVGSHVVDCTMHIMPAGTVSNITYTLSTENRMVMVGSGCVDIQEDCRTIRIRPGTGTLTIVAAKTPELDSLLEKVLEGLDEEARDSAFWGEYLKQGAAVRESVPDTFPEADRIKCALESVAIQTKAQQSFDGGVQAGVYYNMAYVRDQSGVLRGLLRMGYYQSARKILEFWHHKWKRYGDLYNAESMGNEDARLMFSNDEVEVPAYIVFCAMEYLDVTGESDFVISIFDMLKWAMNVQIKHLVNGMTGFSGDETYIAGHIFPRPFIYHGSAESTLLFIESTNRALAFDEAYGLMTLREHDELKRAADNARALYKQNFIVNGVLYGNNPEREKAIALPKFHFGWCQADELLDTVTGSSLTWLERGEKGIYRCPRCIGKKVELPCAPDKRFLLGSVNLLPPYYHTTLFTYGELEKNAHPYMEVFRQTGYVSSEINSERSLGYDFGLFLYNAVYLKNDLAKEALTLTLDMIDSCGTWAEYYKNGEPYGCRCRPWESCINIEAIIYTVEQGIGA